LSPSHSCASLRTINRHLRALILLFVLTANLTYAVPYPQIEAEDISDPEWRAAEFEMWHGAIAGVGIRLDPERFAVVTKTAYWWLGRVVEVVRMPFKPVFRVLKTGQQWGLFAVVAEHPDGLLVEVRRDGEWEVLYRRLDSDHDWRDGMLKYRRLRGVWDGVKDEPKGTYKRFSVWLAKEIFREQPDVDRVRVVLERRHNVLPWEDLDPEVTRRAERHHKRSNHMPDDAP